MVESELNSRTAVAVVTEIDESTTGIVVSGRANIEVLAGAFLAGYSSERTRAAYRADLADFLAWCAAHGADPLAVDRSQVALYARGLEDAGRAPATVARRLSTLAGFYEYAVVEGILDLSPVAHLRRPRVGEDSPTLGLDRGELRQLLEAAAAAGTRDHALVCLLALQGLRVSEACDADIGDLGEHRGHQTLVVVRKGNRRALLPLVPRTLSAVQGHAADRDHGPLLLARDGSRLDRHDAARAIRRLAVTASIDKPLSPHGLRHSFVTLALEAGVPLHRVQDAAGHADPRTTRRYDRARHALDGHASYTLAAFMADA
jgi:integrase/recombinase XerD